MKKAFFFSIDAAAGMVVVFIAIAAMTMFYTSTSGIETKTFEATKTTASDASIVGFYLGKNAGDFGLTTSFTKPDAKFGFCTQHFVYDPNNGAGQYLNSVPNVFCDEK